MLAEQPKYEHNVAHSVLTRPQTMKSPAICYFKRQTGD